MLIILHPLLELGNGEKVNGFLPMAYSDDGSNELDEEIGELEKRRVEVVKEVDDESLDVRTIVILNLLSLKSVNNHPIHILDLP
jgi:hypothetical protein